MERLTIGALARAAGVNVETIRYYERRRLLSRPPKPDEGYRKYPIEAIKRVDGGVEHSLLINPGLRFAINFESGLQIVPGISFPIGIGPSWGEYGVFFYLSFEHPFPALYGKKAMKYAPSFNTKKEEEPGSGT